MTGRIKNAYTPCWSGIDDRELSLNGNNDHDSVCASDSDDHRRGTIIISCACRVISSMASRSVYCDTISLIAPLFEALNNEAAKRRAVQFTVRQAGKTT